MLYRVLQGEWQGHICRLIRLEKDGTWFLNSTTEDVCFHTTPDNISVEEAESSVPLGRVQAGFDSQDTDHGE